MQFAALPSNSTFASIRIINEILQDTKENDNELWLLSQDLRKAYDRVNIFMLIKALQRIKISEKHIFRINTLLDSYIQAKITNFLIQINSSDLLDRLSLLCLAQIQYNNWLLYHPLHFILHYIISTYSSNFLIQSVALCNNNNITFHFNTNFSSYVQEGNIPMLDQVLNGCAQIYMWQQINSLFSSNQYHHLQHWYSDTLSSIHYNQFLMGIIKTVFAINVKSVKLDIHRITPHSENVRYSQSRYQTFTLTKNSANDKNYIGIPSHFNFETDSFTFCHYSLMQSLPYTNEVIIRPCQSCLYNESSQTDHCLISSSISSSIYLQKTQNTKYSLDIHSCPLILKTKYLF
ncbi:hypothetical protein RCL_jg19418.t1 [Rhizophagus clarus]|uniref:Reverse transcriptase domain-containing protein n=1 Tax=Rhizophagus clarus TaxID=94130 RepID=A0A8H3QTB3_9GLOM|nr:hypothetical protein RCL_jg19418.t1 [Rhizophagus clarus]